MSLKPVSRDDNGAQLADRGTETLSDYITVTTDHRPIRFAVDIKEFVLDVVSGTIYVQGMTPCSESLLTNSAVVDAGSGKVQLAATNHGFVSGQVVTIAGCATAGYNGIHTLTSGTTADLLEFSATYHAETPPATAYVMGERVPPFGPGESFGWPVAVDAHTTTCTVYTASATATVRILAVR